MANISNFDVLKAMTKIQLAPLGNITNMKKVKAGTQVTIGVGGDVIFGLMNDAYVGGLILADKKEFDEIREKMVEEADNGEQGES